MHSCVRFGKDPAISPPTISSLGKMTCVNGVETRGIVKTKLDVQGVFLKIGDLLNLKVF